MIFSGGVNGYLNFMIPRLRQMHRLLKPTGSLFVHLDWRMAHYIKIELDKIFGVKNPALKNTNFVNEIIWCYSNSGRAKKGFCKKHDTILWYSKTKRFFWNDYKIPVSEKYLNSHYKQKDKNGKRCRIRVDFGKERTYYPEDGMSCNDWWDDIPSVNSMAIERIGWPTQKPLALLQRIIKSTTKEGDIVADFFCGCGTAIDAAQSLNRRWLGFDASETACQVMSKRMEDRHSLFCGINKKPMTYQDFKNLYDKKKFFEFEKAAVRHIGGVTNDIQIGEGGIDGRLAFDGTPIQVKAESKPMGDNDRYRGFYLHLKEHGRGVYITLNGYTDKAKERASGWRREGLDIQLLSIQDILAGKFREQPLRPKAA